MNVELEDKVTPSEGAALAKLSVTRLRQLAQEGRVEFVMTPLGRLFVRQSLLDYVSKQKGK